MKLSKNVAVAVAAVGILIFGAPPGATVSYETAVSRTIEAGFANLPNGHAITITATVTDGISGTETSGPETTSTAQACITVTKDNGSPRTACGPASVSVDPLLQTATATGTVQGIRFNLDFVADSTPAPAASTGLPTDTTATAALTQPGTATVSLLSDIFGDAATQGSSWYAETREKAESSAQAQ